MCSPAGLGDATAAASQVSSMPVCGDGPVLAWEALLPLLKFLRPWGDAELS